MTNNNLVPLYGTCQCGVFINIHEKTQLLIILTNINTILTPQSINGGNTTTLTSPQSINNGITTTLTPKKYKWC